MSVHIGVIGSGTVGQTLAAGYARHGHPVTIGTREPAKLAAFAEAKPGVTVGDVAAAADAEVVILAVQGAASFPQMNIVGGPLGKTGSIMKAFPTELKAFTKRAAGTAACSRCMSESPGPVK